MRRQFSLLSTRLVLCLFIGLLSAMGFCTKLAEAQSGSIYVEPTGPGVGPGDTIYCDYPVTFNIYYNNNTANYVWGMTNGYRLYSPDGANWQIPVYDTTGGLDNYFGTNVYLYEYDLDGIDADTIALGVYTSSGNGLPPGFNNCVFTISTELDASQNGLTLCLDSCKYGVAGDWIWADSRAYLYPAWGGPYCYEIMLLPNQPPSITNGPTSLEENHCNFMYYDFDASDPEGDNYWFELIDGPGTIDSITGEWTFMPSIEDVGSMYFTVRACDTAGCGVEWITDIMITNEAPIVGNCVNLKAFANDTLSHQFDAIDPDWCDDDFIFSILSVVPSPAGPVSLEPETGLLQFVPDTADAGISFDIEISVTDGLEEDICLFIIDVTATVPKIRIEYIHGGIAGQYEFVSIYTESMVYEMGGFDFLIAYDSSALTFMESTPGQLLEDCGWEYFTYRYGFDGNCGDACPKGLLRIIALAETENGDEHPSCYGPPESLPYELAQIKFLLDGSLTPGDSIPINFCWCECGDNVISNVDGDSLYINRIIYDPDSNIIWDEEDDNLYPEGARPAGVGRPDSCFANDSLPAVRFVDYQNGGILIDTAKEFYTIPELYTNMQFLEGQEVNVWGQYTFPDDSKLIEFYDDFLIDQIMPPQNLIFLEGLEPDSGYWYGGLLIATGLLSTISNPDPGLPEDSVLLNLDVSSFEYIDSGTVIPDSIFPTDIMEIMHEFGEYDNQREDCDTCEFAIIVSGGIDRKNNRTRYWRQIEKQYYYWTAVKNLCPNNIEVLYYDGVSPNPTAVPQNAVRSCTIENIWAAHNEIKAKIANCDSSSVHKVFSNHGTKTGICLLGQNEYLTGDVLVKMQDSLIKACCHFLYDQVITCFGGRIVDSLKKLKDLNKTEIHVNSNAGSNSIGHSTTTDSYFLVMKTLLLMSGLDYESAVDSAKTLYMKVFLPYKNNLYSRKFAHFINKHRNPPPGTSQNRIDRFLELAFAYLEAAVNVSASQNDPSKSWYRIQFKKGCQERKVYVPKGGQLSLAFAGTDGCANVTVYEIQPDGSRKKVKIWNWNIPGSAGYVSGYENRVLNVDSNSTGCFIIHNDDSAFTVTAESHYKCLSAESPSNKLAYAGFSVGSDDSSSGEFGLIYEPVYASYDIDDSGFNLINVPTSIDPWETVQDYTAHFTTSDNEYWENMQLYMDVYNVVEPGWLQISCPDAAVSESNIYVDTSGVYLVGLGGIETRGASSINFYTPQDSGVTFEWDSWMLRSLIETYPHEFICGDANSDSTVNIFDITYIISYLYIDGPPPIFMESADVNNDLTVNIFDITYLIAYLYLEGEEPNCPEIIKR